MNAEQLALSKLLKLAKGYHRALNVPEKSTDWLDIQSSSLLVARLHQYWQQQYPAAGRSYWAIKSWGMLYWQPVYLALISVHELNMSFSLQNFKQHYQQGVIAGLQLSTIKAQYHQNQQQAVTDMAAHLKRYVVKLLTDLNLVARLNERLAMSLLADTLLAILLLHAKRKPQFNIQVMAAHWLHALDISEAGEFIMLTACSDSLALTRKTCCLHYQIGNVAKCANCPKQPQQIKVQRMQQELIAVCYS
ncbi:MULTISPECIES: siderophore ferric iron reductase [Pseudoalteromonas]|uniref:siderophore ferric iron reductase n=1 Tax=Pseudoalteromonas TaxID=53246 RepID=UPI0016020C53|nr:MULTISPECIES: siderophore ferric iron reductase [unclassified Pseudoalteromonas]MBB1334086.1 siderophore ferric iron reductase [Pseudoalteromonas sp. SR41-6]MBB1343175.1 siderophore ferric iron reductase [Pseudoalteromonas sp. SR45-6]MBB1435005.1 siderophore ferric iron reductase [Pseudoalteromonas sp. SG43-6]MBB1459699.1 siderophore ferric iron reductase [Pseudoalteromonas sp. SG41-8]